MDATLISCIEATRAKCNLAPTGKCGMKSFNFARMLTRIQFRKALIILMVAALWQGLGCVERLARLFLLNLQSSSIYNLRLESSLKPIHQKFIQL
jgi:hypothetical protein